MSDKQTTRRVWAVTREDAARSPATEAMLSVLVEAGESYGSEIPAAVAA